MSEIKFQAIVNENTDHEIRSLDTQCINEEQVLLPWWHNFKYAAVGILFGIVFVKSEVVSWFRIQEMFRFDSFHMYGIIGTAVVVGIISIQLIKRLKIKTLHGESIELHDKTFNRGQIYGALIFGFGWAITGACPGPLFAQIGSGFWRSSSPFFQRSPGPGFMVIFGKNCHIELFSAPPPPPKGGRADTRDTI